MGNSSMIESPERNEKLYRMLMTAYDDNGDPFWGVLQELASITGMTIPSLLQEMSLMQKRLCWKQFLKRKS